MMKDLSLRFVVPVLIGLAWVYAAIRLHGDLQGDALQAFGHDGGTDLMLAMIADPPMIIWWITRFPDGVWQAAPLYAYHAVLALLIGSAGRDDLWCRIATAVYALHMAAVFLAILVAGTLGLPREMVGSFDLVRDVEYLIGLTELYPMTVARCALWLIVWQAFALRCLVRGWTKHRSNYRATSSMNRAMSSTG